MERSVAWTSRLEGSVRLPADKSVAHRAALFAALAHGPSVITNFPSSADPRTTLLCLRQLGVRIKEERPGRIMIHGADLREAAGPIDCGNSGTTMRLLAGILAGQPFPSTLTGDASLGLRPMTRVARPLTQMRARVRLDEGRAPIQIGPNQGLRGITYTLPVPSAQVKSCVLLAGLFAEGETSVVEKIPSRDHTERMLGLPVDESGGLRFITVSRRHQVQACARTLPLDFSAAAFFLVAGAIVESGVITLPGVGLNPSRTAFLDVLRDMGADIRIDERRTSGGEPMGDLTVRPSHLKAVTVGGAVIPNLIDEIPVLAVAAACAEGRTEIRDAAELRVKESDRIRAIVTNMRALGADVEEMADGFAITGPCALTGAKVDSFKDHRIAMAMGVAGLVAKDATTIAHAEVASVSYPDFFSTLGRLARGA